jgi:hypothetical protein
MSADRELRVSNQQHGQANSPPESSLVSLGDPGHTRLSAAGMRATAENLEKAADLLDTYLQKAYVETLNEPGTDPVSVQATRVLRERLDSERKAVQELAATFRQHAADVRRQWATSLETDDELYSAFRGKLCAE